MRSFTRRKCSSLHAQGRSVAAVGLARLPADVSMCQHRIEAYEQVEYVCMKVHSLLRPSTWMCNDMQHLFQ